MPATSCYQTIRGQAMRLTAVDACGAPIIGLKSVVTSDGFISIKYTLDYEDGEDTTQKNAAQVEQASAAALALQQQARALVDTVRIFRLDGVAAPVNRALPAAERTLLLA